MSLLDRARLEASKARDEYSRLIWRTHVGVYHARRGDKNEVAREVQELRSRSSPSEYTRAIAAANLIEGVEAFCEMHFSVSSDKLRRAIAMANSIGEKSLLNWAEAWLCHVLYSSAKYADSAKLATAVLEQCAPNEHAAISRTATTVAGACHFFDGYSSARPWYELARLHAVSQEDDLTIDAILHGIAAFHLNKLRLMELSETPDPGEIRRASMELASSQNYDRLKAPTSFRWMIPLQEIHLAMVGEEWQQALSQIDEWLSALGGSAPERHASILRADRAVCLARLGRADAAGAAIDGALEQIAPDAESDDLAIIQFQCSRAAGLVGRDQQSTLLATRSRDSMKRFETERELYRPAFLAIRRPTDA